MKPEDLNKLSLDEACQYAVKKIVEQGGRCLGNTGCAYGDRQGNHCAVGWLLDETDQGLMGYPGGIGDLFGLVPALIRNNMRAFQRLQAFHDSKEANWRVHYCRALQDEYDIDTSGPHWQQWIDMGAE